MRGVRGVGGWSGTGREGRDRVGGWLGVVAGAGAGRGPQNRPWVLVITVYEGVKLQRQEVWFEGKFFIFSHSIFTYILTYLLHGAESFLRS